MTNCQCQLQQHFTILGWLLIIQHVILLLVAEAVVANRFRRGSAEDALPAHLNPRLSQ